MIEDRRVDNTAPASTTTFPAASGTYNTASWAAGCTTIGLCGTYSDAGLGRLPGADLAPPGLGQLLERLRLLERRRGLERGEPPGWELVVRIRRRRLPGGRKLHRPGAGGRRGGQRRTPLEPDVHDRPGAPQTTIDSNPIEPDGLDLRRLRLLLERGRLDVRVPPRRRRLGRVHQPEELHQPRRRQPHLRRTRHRRRRQPGRLAGLVHLAGRHDGAELHHDLPGRERRVQRDRLGRRLRHRRPLRHLLRRHRLRRRPGAGLDPPGCGQLLERHQLRQRLRGLEQLDGRRRQLVVRVRRGQLPRRRQLHRAGARGRRRREHRVPVEPNLHVRHDEPERALHLPGLRRQLHEHHLERGLRHERLLRHLLRQPLRRPGRPGVDPARLERPLLERHLVRLGVRGVPDRKPRGRQLVARLPGGELPRRRSVHGPRARERRRAEHRDGPVADVPDRQHGAGLDRHLPRLGRHLQHRRLERRLRDERLLRHPLGRAAPASSRSRSRSARARATTGTAPASPAAPRSGTRRPSPAATGR